MALLSRSRLAVLLLPAALAGLVAGCGGSDAPTAAAPVATAAPAATSPAAAATTGDAPATSAGAAGAAGATTPASGSSASTGSARGVAVDKAFVRQMTPHHQGALVMSALALQNAARPQVKSLALRIDKLQTSQIQTLHDIATELKVTPPAAMGNDGKMGANPSMSADARTLGIESADMGMSMNLPALQQAKPFDQAFLSLMVAHHRGAIRMAKAEIKDGSDPRLKALAQTIARGQRSEVSLMQRWLKQWYA